MQKNVDLSNLSFYGWLCSRWQSCPTSGYRAIIESDQKVDICEMCINTCCTPHGWGL